MSSYKVEFDKDVCIGTLYCQVAAENFFKIGDDGKAELIGSLFNQKTGKFELIIDESAFAVNEDAADGCPVEAIIISKLERLND